MNSAFLIAATVVFFFLGLIWKSSNFLNVFLRLTFFCLAGWGAYIIFKG